MTRKERDFEIPLARFDSLAAEARNILADCEEANGTVTDIIGVYEWRTKAATLLTLMAPQEHIHRQSAEKLKDLSPTVEELQLTIGLMRGVKDDLSKGMLVPLRAQIEAEFSADFMRQASDLLKGDGEQGHSYYLPAAVEALPLSPSSTGFGSNPSAPCSSSTPSSTSPTASAPSP